MNPMMMSVMMLLAILASCHGSGGSAPSASMTGSPATGAMTGGTAGALRKVEGPAMDRLSMNQIQSIVQTCFAHHDLDDARVPYTRTYCEKVFSERDRRSMRIRPESTGNSAPVSLH